MQWTLTTVIAVLALGLGLFNTWRAELRDRRARRALEPTATLRFEPDRDVHNLFAAHINLVNPTAYPASVTKVEITQPRRPLLHQFDGATKTDGGGGFARVGGAPTGPGALVLQNSGVRCVTAKPGTTIDSRFGFHVLLDTVSRSGSVDLAFSVTVTVRGPELQKFEVSVMRTVEIGPFASP